MYEILRQRLLPSDGGKYVYTCVLYTNNSVPRMMIFNNLVLFFITGQLPFHHKVVIGATGGKF